MAMMMAPMHDFDHGIAPQLAERVLRGARACVPHQRGVSQSLLTAAIATMAKNSATFVSSKRP